MIFVISAPSGTGKTTVLNRLFTKYRLERQLTCTTRPPRANEHEGSDYRFLDVAAFYALRDSGRLAEWAFTYGHYYGTPREDLERALAAHRPVLLQLDTRGAAQIRARYPGLTVLVGLLPPSRAALAERLSRRQAGTGEDPAAQARRLAAADAEMAVIEGYDHRIVNDDPDRAAEALYRLIRRAEKSGGNPPATSPG